MTQGVECLSSKHNHDFKPQSHQKKCFQVWWHIPIIPALRKEDYEFQASLGDIVRDPISNKQTNNKK
jgi:hypothetical protein